MDSQQKIIKEIEKKYTKKSNVNIITLVKENISKLAVLLISIVYIAYGLFVLTNKDTTVIEILGNIGISLLVGMTITICMRNAGVQDARKTELFKSVQMEFHQSKESIFHHADKLVAFCNMKNANAIETEKRTVIEGALLNYKGWKAGFYEQEEHRKKLLPEQLSALKIVNEIKVNMISSTDLVSLSNNTSKYFKKYGAFGQTEKQHMKTKTILGLVTTILFSIVFGYFSLDSNAQNEDILATMMWNIFQIMIWLGNGTIKYLDSRNFILYEFTENSIKTRISYLKEFKAILENNPTILEKYDDNIADEIDKFIQEQEKMEYVNS